MDEYRPIDVAVALSLYAYNVSPYHRAEVIFKHFDGACAEMDDLIRHVSHYPGTSLAAPSMVVYVEQALAKYGEEAVKRNRAEGV